MELIIIIGILIILLYGVLWIYAYRRGEREMQEGEERGKRFFYVE